MFKDMKASIKFAVVASFFLSGTAAANTVDLVGDIDWLGGAIAPGATSFPGYFDNRSAAELSASDGAQYTDNASGAYGTTYANPVFSHSFSSYSTITSASWEIGLGGLQSYNDKLFLDGTLIASGNELPEQGSNGYGIFTIDITSFASLLLDGTANFLFNLNSNNSGEPIVFDYAKLTIVGTPSVSQVPVPAAVWLMGSGLLGLMGISRKKKA